MTADLVTMTVEEGQLPPHRIASRDEITSLLGYADFAGDFAMVDMCKKALLGDLAANEDCRKLLDFMDTSSWKSIESD